MDKHEFLSEYRTGDVQPPKSYRIPVTVLLLLVIFLGSLISALSFGGIRLFRLLGSEKTNTSVRFIDEMRLSPVAEAENYTEIHSLGIQGRFLTAFEQRYFDLPQGVYISGTSQLVPDLCTGDVLLKINGEEISYQEMLDTLLESHAHGAILSLEIYRNGHHQSLSAILFKDFEEN
ncbi:MAG: PDZ domain-containing protein [Oscillospiraceae bacterium]|nr:PDZ domain-containing protein [Oscillospiraceae bacterium]